MYLILFLIFITNAFCQPGPIQTTEQGISNYQIQALPPTTTPIAGKQYLYNANNVLSTKDSAGTIVRVNKDPKNILANPDFEQNLDSYTFTAGKAVINTATPLFDKVSVNFDASAVNDVISTVPYLLPIGLQGGTCMAKITYQASDANLSFRVINADNVVIDQGVLQAVTHPTPVHLVFACPPGTATVNQRTLRVQVIQTGTDAALATLDMFYLGELDAQTMAVTEGVEELRATTLSYAPTTGQRLDWSNITKNSISFCGTVTINDATNRFTYTGKNPCSLNIVCSYESNAGGASAANTIRLNGNIINGFVTRGDGANSTASVAPSSLIAGGNDVIDCLKSTAFAANAGNSAYLNITATPLSQIATVVPTTQTRAGAFASRTWIPAGGCNWGRTATSFGPYTATASCGATAPINSGFAIADTSLNGQLPQVTLSKYPKGKYLIIATSGLQAVGTTGANVSYRVNDGATASSPLSIGAGSFPASTQIGGLSGAFLLENPSDKGQTILSFEGFGSGAGGSNAVILSDTSYRIFQIQVYYLPDLSDSTEGITVNKMLPIVQGSETVVEYFEGSGPTQNPTNRFYLNTTISNTISSCGTITMGTDTTTANSFKYTGKKSCLTNINICNRAGVNSGIVSISLFINDILMLGGTYDNTTAAASTGDCVSANKIMNNGDVLNFGSGTTNNNQIPYVQITATSFGKPGVITSDAVVTNSGATTARKWRTESCYITNTGTAAMASSSCNTWVQSVSRTGAGTVTVNFIPGTFSPPYVACSCIVDRVIASTVEDCQIITSNSNTTTSFNTFDTATGTAGDGSFNISCQGIE